MILIILLLILTACNAMPIDGWEDERGKTTYPPQQFFGNPHMRSKMSALLRYLEDNVLQAGLRVSQLYIPHSKAA